MQIRYIATIEQPDGTILTDSCSGNTARTAAVALSCMKRDLAEDYPGAKVTIRKVSA